MPQLGIFQNKTAYISPTPPLYLPYISPVSPQVDLFKNKTAFPLIFGTIMTLSIIWGAIGYGWMKNYGVTYAYLGYDLDGDKDDPLYVIVFPIRFVLLISLMIPISLEVRCR